MTLREHYNYPFEAADLLFADLSSPDGASMVGFRPPGGGIRNLQDTFSDGFNVLNYESDAGRKDLLSGNPQLDHSAALAAAIAALPTNGGTIDITVARFPCNVTITRNGVHLRGTGQSSWLGTGSAFRGLVPFNPALPVITVGDDTRYVSGTELTNLTISNPTGLGQYGLKLYGGTYGFSANGLTINGFIGRCLWVENGPNFPSTYLTIANFSFFTGNAADATASAVYFKYAASLPASFATSLFLSNGNIGSASNLARQIRLDGTQINLSNVYVQCPSSHTGLYMEKTNSGAQTPLAFCSNVIIDTDNPSSVLLDYPFSSSVNVSDAIRGGCNLNGQMQNSDGTLIPSPGASSYTLASYSFNPVVAGSQTFPDKANWADNSARITGTGAAGARGIDVYAGTYRFWPGTGGFAQFASPVGDSTATFRLYDQLNNRSTDIKCEAGTLHLTSFGGGRAIKLGDGTWNSQPVALGAYFLWVDASGNLRIKSGAPTGDTDGVIVGGQA